MNRVQHQCEVIYALLLDLDGVLWVRKENPRYVGGREVVEKLKRTGKTTFVLTNDSTHMREEICQSLTKLGFSFSIEEILTSSYLTARYLTERYGKAAFYLIGEDGIGRELEAAGALRVN